jgi:hypothetical protein
MKLRQIEIQIEDVDSAPHPPCELSLRFSCFPLVCNQDALTNSRFFERTYECGTKTAAPHLQELQQSHDAYLLFLKSESIPMTPGDSSFWNLLRKSCPGTIYFIDPHFGKKNLARLYALANDIELSPDHAQKDFVVIKKSDNEDVGMQEFVKDRLSETRTWKYASLRVYILKNTNIKELLHDRFVLMGRYFWHFGSSAGGMHDCLTAFSGPWFDTENSLMNLVKEITEHNPLPKVFCSRGRNNE